MILDYKQDAAEDLDKIGVISPSSKSVVSSDTTLYRLVFKANSLKRGQCYHLKFSNSNSILIDPAMRDSPEL